MWILVAIGGYFLNALSAIINKVLLQKSIPHPRVYAFFTAVLGMLAFIMAPWGFSLISFYNIVISFIIGILFVAALVYLFISLRLAEASRVVPLVGGVQPIAILLLSFWLLGERLAVWQLLAFVFLVGGGILISWQKKKNKKESYKWAGYAFISGILFASFYTLTKYLFNVEEFVDAFLWPRLGSFIAALFLLFNKQTRQKIIGTKKTAKPSAYGVFIFGQAAGGVSFLLINYAIFLGSVALVNALQGTQYAFVFLLAILLSWKLPQILQEKISKSIIMQKTFAIILIVIGIILLNV